MLLYMLPHTRHTLPHTRHTLVRGAARMLLYTPPHTMRTLPHTRHTLVRVAARMLPYMCPHTTTYYYMCPHTTTYYYMQTGASGSNVALQIVRFGSGIAAAYAYICVLILLYMCPHTTIYASSYRRIWLECDAADRAVW
jgi:hypothetical protein